MTGSAKVRTTASHSSGDEIPRDLIFSFGVNQKPLVQIVAVARATGVGMQRITVRNISPADVAQPITRTRPHLGAAILRPGRSVPSSRISTSLCGSEPKLTAVQIRA